MGAGGSFCEQSRRIDLFVRGFGLAVVQFSPWHAGVGRAGGKYAGGIRQIPGARICTGGIWRLASGGGSVGGNRSERSCAVHAGGTVWGRTGAGGCDGECRASVACLGTLLFDLLCALFPVYRHAVRNATEGASVPLVAAGICLFVCSFCVPNCEVAVSGNAQTRLEKLQTSFYDHLLYSVFEKCDYMTSILNDETSSALMSFSNLKIGR